MAKLLQLVRACLAQLMLLQRVPILILGASLILCTRLSYALFGRHRIFLLMLKWTFRIGFFFRGIHFSIQPSDQPSVYDLPGIHVCNDFHMSYWLLFAFLPYDHLIVPTDAFFSNDWFRATLFIFGFMPQEYGMTPTNFKSFDSRLDVYLDQGFSVWQPVFFEYRDLNSLPYAVIMAIKHQMPIHIWRCDPVAQLDAVHWLKRRKITLTLVNEVAISRRYALTISAYYEAISRYFGPSLIAELTDLKSAPDMPPSNTDLARQKIKESQRIARELENEGRDL